MKNNKSPLDFFLQKRISDNAKMLKENLSGSLQTEQACLEQILLSINHCKKNISICEKSMRTCDTSSLYKYESSKLAFIDNLIIWNTMGHIQMASIEMKEYIKRLSVENINDWELQDTIKSAYMTIYETSKRLIDGTAKIIQLINSYFPNYDSTMFKAVRKELTIFRENNSAELTRIRNSIAAHRNQDISTQVEIIDGLHLYDSMKLIIEYNNIINNLGKVTSPIKELGIRRLEAIQ